MDIESVVSFLATISIFLAACHKYGHNILDQLSSLKAPKASGSRFSTHALLILFDQSSLDYVKAFIKSLLPGPFRSLEGKFDITDVLRASVYLQLRTSGHYLQLLQTFDLTKVPPKKWAEVLYVAYFHFNSLQDEDLTFLSELDKLTLDFYNVDTYDLPLRTCDYTSLDSEEKVPKTLPLRKFRAVFMQHFISENFKRSDPLCGYTDCPQCGATYFQPKDFLKHKTPACCFAVQNLCPGCWSSYTYIPFQDDWTRTDLVNPCPVACCPPWRYLFQRHRHPRGRTGNAFNLFLDSNNN